jgi:hypothetical protein
VLLPLEASASTSTSPLSLILGLICLVVQVATSGENPRQCGRSSNRPDLATKHNPWKPSWLVSQMAKSQYYWPRVISGCLLKICKFKTLQVPPVEVVREPKWEDRICVFSILGDWWWAGCIIYSLSLLFSAWLTPDKVGSRAVASG